MMRRHLLLTAVFLLAGAVVLVATVQATRRERVREAALLKALGARLRTLYQGIAAEFVLLGVLAGVIGAIVAGALGWSVSRFIFELSYVPSPALLWYGVLCGGVGIGICGVLVTRGALKQPPTRLLSDQ